jgi:tartrate dehydratase alpha subunit/fumarate hydratase class I-like protein
LYAKREKFEQELLEELRRDQFDEASRDAEKDLAKIIKPAAKEKEARERAKKEAEQRKIQR